MRILIAVIWFVVLADAAWQAHFLQDWPNDVGEIPLWFGIVSVLLPVVFFPFFGMRATKSPFYVEGLARWIDARAGAGTYNTFLSRLRPMLLFGTAALILGAVSLARGLSAGADPNRLFVAAFYVSCAVGFFLLHIMLKRRGLLGA